MSTENASLSLPPSDCSTFVRMFKPQFQNLVLSGEKCQTIRPIPKRMPKPGDRISLRCWSGKPYRSKQRVLREAVVTRVEEVEISAAWIRVGNKKLSIIEEWAFAQADGFSRASELTEWFAFNHGIPFIGVLICWSNVPDHPPLAETSTTTQNNE